MLVPPQEEMKICSFLWVYYGYPTASYEGINVEEMRYHCGAMLAKRDAGSNVHPDLIAGVPDSGIAHAIGYANESKVPFARPSSNIPRPGHAPLCRPTRNREI